MQPGVCFVILAATVATGVSGRALSEIYNALSKCEEHCENNPSCVQGCRLMESRDKGECDTKCKGIADQEQCMKGCKFDAEPKVAFRRIIIKTNIPSLQFGQDLDLVNKLMQLFSPIQSMIINKKNNESSGSPVAAEKQDEEEQEVRPAVNIVRIPLVSRCNRLMTLREWAALQQQRIASGTLECWLIASMIVLLSCTLWLLIWMRQVKQHRRDAQVCEQTEKDVEASMEQDEKLPEYNNVVGGGNTTCKV